MIKRASVICDDSRTALLELENSVDLIVTSPPYADARSKHYDSIHPDAFVDWFLSFEEPMRRALKSDGSLVINIKDKVVDGQRHRYVWHAIEAFARRGWFAIDDYIWSKPNPMPGFWPTRLRDGWEYCFHLSRSKRPYVDFDAVRQPIGSWSQSRLSNLSKADTQRHDSVNRSGFGRNISRWLERDTVLPSNILSIPLVGKNKGHPAVYPVELPAFFIRLLCRPGGLVVDPFAGSGTTGIAAHNEGRDFVLIDNNIEYCRIARERLLRECGLTDLGANNAHPTARRRARQRDLPLPRAKYGNAEFRIQGH